MTYIFIVELFCLVTTWFGEDFQCINHILAVFWSLVLKGKSTEILEVHYCICGHWFVLYVVYSCMKNLQEMEKRTGIHACGGRVIFEFTVSSSSAFLLDEKMR